MDALLDDMGAPVRLADRPTRLVSLVPSLTEAIAATCPERLVGATDWCVQPPGLSVARVRGTKNPDRQAVARLRPDLVVANQEENRAVDVERLRAEGVPVWVTVTESVDGALRSLRRLVVQVLGVPAPAWLEAAEAAFAGPAPPPATTVVVPVWRDPWMVVGPRTYADDLLRRAGFANLYGEEALRPDDSRNRGSRRSARGASRRGTGAGSGRYPRVVLEDLLEARPDVVLLPDEPYPFTAADGPEAFPGLPTALVAGRTLTWYGPAMVTAAAELRRAADLAVSR